MSIPKHAPCDELLKAALTLEEKMDANFQIYAVDEHELFELTKKCDDKDALLKLAAMFSETILMGTGYDNSLRLLKLIVQKTQLSEAQELLYKYKLLKGTEEEAD
ncbi:hypothetical protein EON80_16790 [bacterium]|nr:MAG: hypothetical protein EON80_16790 [bacterium]